jgi:hypothetical protein
MELLPSLLAGLRAVCATFPDPRKGRRGNIAMADFGLSAFALFFMQSASFLAFQRALEKGHGRSNCQTLFGIEKIPSDNYIRDMLDAADPALLRPCFERMEQLLAAPPLRQAFGRLGDRTLIAWDGTEYFCSQKLGCPHCLRRKRANGKIESYHTMLAATAVAPGHAKVVPLFPEFIAPQDGADKQDCERNAVKRWHCKHGERLRPLRPVYLGDELFAISVQIQLAEELPVVQGDRVQLQQVILNLLVNAIEAMSGMSEGPRELLISTRKTGSEAMHVVVHDSGPGLAPGQRVEVNIVAAREFPAGISGPRRRAFVAF